MATPCRNRTRDFQVIALEKSFLGYSFPEDLVDEPPSHPIQPAPVIVEWMRYCEDCDLETRFVADRICLVGLLGSCSRCGEERIAPFTRGNSETA